MVEEEAKGVALKKTTQYLKMLRTFGESRGWGEKDMRRIAEVRNRPKS